MRTSPNPGELGHLAEWCHNQIPYTFNEDERYERGLCLFLSMSTFLDKNGWDLADAGWPSVRQKLDASRCTPDRCAHA